jgi:hypothetical protein
VGRQLAIAGLENLGASMSHNPAVLQNLLQGEVYLFISFVTSTGNSSEVSLHAALPLYLNRTLLLITMNSNLTLQYFVRTTRIGYFLQTFIAACKQVLRQVLKV